MVATAPRKEFFASLLYIGSESQSMKAELQNLICQYFPHLEARICFKSPLKISNFFNVKDRLPKRLRSCIIYNYSCSACSASYLGSTQRALYMREAEHLGISYRTGLPLTKPLQSAIRSHSVQCAALERKNFNIVGSEKNVLKLRILESLQISRNKPILNMTESAFALQIAV